MSVTIQDNFKVASAKAIDSKYGLTSAGGATVPYNSTADVLSGPDSIPLSYRYQGLTVAVKDGVSSVKEYWFKDNLTTLVPKSGAVSDAKNGLTLDTSDGKIKLGGTLTDPQTSVSYSGTEYKSLVFTIEKPTNFSQFYFDNNAPLIVTGNLPNDITSLSGSASALSLFRTVGAIWTKNYDSYAFRAQEKWLAARPWVPTPLNDNYAFQIYNNIVTSNGSSGILGHYYDERVESSYWNQTWTGSYSLVAGTTYTLRTKAVGDNFPATLGTTVSGTPNSSGWVFTSNGTQPTWTNGSIVDGNFPKIDWNERSAMVKVYETESGKGRVLAKANRTDVNSYQTTIGYSNDPGNSTYSLMSGYSNTINANGYYQVVLGGGNVCTGGNGSFIIGEGHFLKNGMSGVLGGYISNSGQYSTGIGYGLRIPSSVGSTPTNVIGSLHTGVFNNPDGRDYRTGIDLTSENYPVFSIGTGDQAGLNPAFYYNGFHVMKDGSVKSKDGVDARYGRRGMVLPQWTTTGWESTGGQTFTAGAKYIILNYGFALISGASSSGAVVTGTVSGGTAQVGASVEIVGGTGQLQADTKIQSLSPITLDKVPTQALSNAKLRIGDNFNNVTSDIIWGNANSTGCVFYGSTGSATLWTYGSTVAKVGRPSSPQKGEMGFNLTLGQMEYYTGSTWVQF